MNNINFVGRQLRTYSIVQHSHRDWELIYCTSGQGEFVFDRGEPIKYKKGEVIAIPPGLKHINHSEEGFTNINLTISEATLPYRSAKKIVDETDHQIYRSFTEASYYFNSDIMNKDLVLSALGSLIVSYIIVYLGKNNSSEVVSQIRKDILENFTDANYSLDSFLKSLPFSYDYLRKLFKREMEITPNEYLMRTRLNAAQMMLTGTSKNDYSISEISEMCGFSEPLYFSRVFKKRLGISPTQYAIRYEKEHEEDINDNDKK